MNDEDKTGRAEARKSGRAEKSRREEEKKKLSGIRVNQCNRPYVDTLISHYFTISNTNWSTA
ncbi:MAG: hypothetical protein NT166_23360 [Candidatus Aminicenantes bacterium]|nr:hypothetical protein [Candidatus Aminicenantes bacterium]